jgi:glycosyltransferase involved in cell wall biosynthesis
MPISGTQILISIVIPTHNRAEVLLQTLNSLAKQSLSQLLYEVIVVADGCTDQTVEKVRNFEASYKLQILEQVGSGAGAARNSGALKATGLFLLFLDDDITATPLLVEAHLNAQQRCENRVVIGYLPPVFKQRRGYFQMKLKVWWEEMFHAMTINGHRFNYRNLLSGNFSLPAQLFHLVGGFDTSFTCQEDYELGVRLLKADAQFAFEPLAMGYHYETTNVTRWLYRKYSEGRTAVQFYQNYPQLSETIPVIKLFVEGIPPFYQKSIKFIHQRKYFAKALFSIYRLFLYLSERLHMPLIWEKLLGRLQTYWYLKGMIDAAGGWESIKSLFRELPHTQDNASSIIDINLECGIDAAEKYLNELKPLSVNLFYGKHFIGHIPAKFGFEPLSGVHLRLLLAQEFSGPFMHAKAFDKVAHQ